MSLLISVVALEFQLCKFCFTLGTIHLLRPHIFGPFMTHPLCQHKYSTLHQQKLLFLTHPLCPFADVIYGWSPSYLTLSFSGILKRLFLSHCIAKELMRQKHRSEKSQGKGEIARIASEMQLENPQRQIFLNLIDDEDRNIKELQQNKNPPRI